MQPSTILREHNDRFRAGDEEIPGQIVVTSNLAAHLTAAGETDLRQLYEVVATYDNFTPDNDPHSEHDFGVFEVAGETCYWKIDLYNPDLTSGTEDPTDLAKTSRVLTVMLARDY